MVWAEREGTGASEAQWRSKCFNYAINYGSPAPGLETKSIVPSWGRDEMLHILAMLPAICPLPETLDTPNAPACNSLAFACAVVCSLTRTGPCAARAAMWATVSCGSVRPNITHAPRVATGSRGARLRGGGTPPRGLGRHG